MGSKSDIGKTWTWTQFKPSLCSGCWAGCCTLPVEVTTNDLLKLELISEDESKGSLRKLARRLEKAGVIKNVRLTTGLFMLSQKPSGDCIFLDTQRLCTVYDKRPEVCRDFPAVRGPRVGYCPHAES